MPETVPLIFLDSNSANDFGHSWRFSDHVETVQAFAHGEVLPSLARVEKASAAGFHAVGFIAYEAAPGLNAALPQTPPLDGLPLLWFAIFRERHAAAADAAATESPDPPQLAADSPRQNYLQNVERIKEYIACGDSYQVNYTFTMNGAFVGEPLSLYRRISRGQSVSFNAFIDSGRFCNTAIS